MLSRPYSAIINDQNEDKLSSESRFSLESLGYDLNLAHYLAFIKFMRLCVNFIVIPLVNPRVCKMLIVYCQHTYVNASLVKQVERYMLLLIFLYLASR